MKASPELVVLVPPGRQEERTYAVSVVLDDILGIPHRCEPGPPGAWLVRPPGGACIELPDTFFPAADRAWLDRGSSPAISGHRLTADADGLLDRPLHEGLPVVCGHPGGGADRWVETQVGGRFRIGIDIFGSAFRCTTCYDEACGGDALDEHGRNRGSASLAAQHGYLERPIVGEYAEVLAAALKKAGYRADRRRTGAAIPTHDVDRPFLSAHLGMARGLRRSISIMVRQRDPRLAAGAACAALGLTSSDPYNSHRWLMAADAAEDLSGIHYLLAPLVRVGHDGDVDPEAPVFRRLLALLRSGPHRLGYHPSYTAGHEPELMQQEFARLRALCGDDARPATAWSIRPHYLRWRPRGSWEAYERLGVGTSSSAAYADVYGFRCGMCHPFRPFSLDLRRRLELTELPLAYMEKTLLDRKYLGLAPAEAEARIRQLAARIRRCSGTPIHLWHNCTFATAWARALYRRVAAL